MVRQRTSLTSIPAIEGLQELNCDGCTLLTSIPAIEGLEHLVCSGCTLLTSIPAMEGLQDLECIDCTSLTTIPAIEELKEVNCSGCTSLTSIPAIKELEYLDCDDCTWLECNEGFENRLEKLKILQKMVRRWIIMWRLNLIIPAVRELWYEPGSKGAWLAELSFRSISTQEF